MAAAKKTTANQKRNTTANRNRSTEAKPKERTSRIINDDDEKGLSPARQREIYLFVYLAVGIFMLCSNFGICGAIGRVISGFFFGLFGWVQYLLPVYAFLAAAFILSNGPKKSIIRKLIWIGVLMMVCSFIAQLVHGMDAVTAKSLYMDGYSEHAGGGFFFGGLLSLLYNMVGKVGVVILVVLLTIVAVIQITGVSVIAMVKKIFTFNYHDVYSYDDEDEDAEDEEPVIRRRRRDPKAIISDLEVRESEDSPKKGRKGAKDRAKQEVVPDEEMQELIPDPYQNEMEDLKAAARKKVADKKLRGEEESVFAKQEEPRPNRMVPVAPDRGLSVPSDESFRNGAMSRGVEEEEHLPKKEATAMDFFDLTPAKESYDDEVGGDWDQETETDYTDEDDDYSDSAFAKPAVKTAPSRSSSTQTAGAGVSVTAAGTGASRTARTPAAAEEGNEPVYADGLEELPVETKVTHQDTLQATGQIQQEMQQTVEKPKKRPYRIPPVNLLNPAKKSGNKGDADVRETAIKLKQTLESFGVNVTITDYSRGPAVTRYELTPEQGVKVSKILSLSDDIKLNLAAADIRIEAPIPGKSAIGIEVPNKENQMVSFRELIDNDTFKNAKSKISFAIGKDIGGQTIIGDIAKMPHMLIAGATGSGKSVCINTIIMSILYKAKPEEVRLIMVDPKQVELAAYNGIPHMLIPVVTDAKKAAGALNWAVQEMERRYKLFAKHNVRNLEGFNKKVSENPADPDDLSNADFRFMPQIVVIVDELADLMMVAHGEVEDAIVRLCQLARAAGIHLIIATQRPSVDIITGLIKANVPSRIAFAVSSGVDSRTILDMVGAEKLLGKGDMLYYPTGVPKPLRVQGAFVSDEEVLAVTDYIKKQTGDVEYDESVAESINSGASGGGGSSAAAAEEEGERYDEYFEEAGRLVIEKEKASIGYLQRVFRIGFNRAARIMDQLADAGVVGPEEGTKPRKILMTMDQFEEFMQA